MSDERGADECVWCRSAKEIQREHEQLRALEPRREPFARGSAAWWALSGLMVVSALGVFGVPVAILVGIVGNAAGWWAL